MGNARRLPQSRGPGFFLVASPHVNRRANLILGGQLRTGFARGLCQPCSTRSLRSNLAVDLLPA